MAPATIFGLDMVKALSDTASMRRPTVLQFGGLCGGINAWSSIGRVMKVAVPKRVAGNTEERPGPLMTGQQPTNRGELMMRTLLALALMAVMAGGAVVDGHAEGVNTLGIFFDGEAWTGAYDTNSDVVSASPFAGPFAYAYLVLINPTTPIMATVEFGIIHTAAPFAIDGWSNVVLFGPTPNYIAQADMMEGTGLSAIYTWTPNYFEVEQNGATVLLRWRLLNYVEEENHIKIGPMRHLEPSRPGYAVYDAPGHVNPVDGSTIYLLTPPIEWDLVDEHGYGVVATFHGDGVVATENSTLTGVKSLFR